MIKLVSVLILVSGALVFSACSEFEDGGDPELVGRWGIFGEYNTELTFSGMTYALITLESPGVILDGEKGTWQAAQGVLTLTKNSVWEYMTESWNSVSAQTRSGEYSISGGQLTYTEDGQSPVVYTRID
jgi:hypothetical protein